MKTNQVMRRDFGDTFISQRTIDGYFNATELLDFYNFNFKKSKRFKDFWDNDGTDNFKESLCKELNGDNSAHLKTIVKDDLSESTRGRNGCTWMHPYLFVKFAMWLSSDFEVKVIKWVYDNLIDFRNQAGDYHTEMCSVIMSKYVECFGNKPDVFVFSNEVKYINYLVKGVYSSIERNVLTEKELDLLNNLQRLNIDFIERGIGKDKRKSILRDYAEMYKVANFL